jgi:hypothetical protein
MVQLVRYKSTEKLMLGMFYVGQEIFYTLEPPWRNNQKNLSCIPEGLYKCKRAIHYNRNGSNYPAWEITDIQERSNVHIHKGNYPSDTTGCPLLGMEVSKNEESIKNSTEAFTRFMEYTQSVDEFDLKITSIYDNELVIIEPKPRKPQKPATELIELGDKEKWYYKVRTWAGNIVSALLAGVGDAKNKFEKTKWEKFWNTAKDVLTILATILKLKK